MDRIEFEDALQAYEKRFDSMEPELELTIRDPELGVEGWVVVWSTLSCKDGPLGRVGKGGTRIHSDMSMDELRMLAVEIADIEEMRSDISADRDTLTCKDVSDL